MPATLKGAFGPLVYRRKSIMITRIGVGARMSQAVVHNGTVYLAGQVGEGATVAEQTRDCLAQVDALLAQAGSS